MPVAFIQSMKGSLVTTAAPPARRPRPAPARREATHEPRGVAGHDAGRHGGRHDGAGRHHGARADVGHHHGGFTDEGVRAEHDLAQLADVGGRPPAVVVLVELGAAQQAGAAAHRRAFAQVGRADERPHAHVHTALDDGFAVRDERAETDGAVGIAAVERVAVIGAAHEQPGQAGEEGQHLRAHAERALVAGQQPLLEEAQHAERHRHDERRGVDHRLQCGAQRVGPVGHDVTASA
jgi:hypothetical protein